MRIFIVTKATWNLPNILVHQTVCDLIAAGFHQSTAEIIVVSDGFNGILPPGATLMSTEEAENLVISCANAAIIHFGLSIKGADHFPQYFIDLTHPKQLEEGFFANWMAQLAYNKTIKKATKVFGWLDIPAPSLPSFEWSDLALAKSRNSGGDNYFMAFMPLVEIVPTLKEFSIFKKWQQTSMAILFVCKDQKELDKAEALVKGYKYRNAVFFKLAETIDLIDFAAAYCTVWSSATNYYTRFMQWSAGLGVPLLINSKTNYAIAYTKAGECFDFTETMGLSNHFKLYYKDEVYKQSKANHGHAWFNQMTTEGSTKNASLLDRCLP
jgi:hypothetical protein